MNNNKRNVDFTQGSVMKGLIFFAVPLLVGAIFQLMYNMVDSAVLGKFVSVNALAAVGATGTTHMLVMMVSNAVTNAMSIQASHAWGARNKVLLRKLLGQCVMMVSVLGITMMIVMQFASRPIMLLLSTPENILDDAVLYVRITCGFFIGQLFYNMATSVLRAIGDSRTPLYFLIFSSLLNIGLDLLFVVVFHWDVAGVAYATIISQILSALLCMTYMFKRYDFLRFSLKDMKPDKELLGRYAKIALPLAFQGIVISIGDMTVTKVINSFGSDTIAAYTIGQKCLQIVQMMFSQIAFSMSVFTGQNYGAKLYDRIKYGMRQALLLLGILVAVAMVIMFAFGDQLMLIYMDPNTAGEEVPRLVHQYLNITTWFLPFLCGIWAFTSALRGMGFITPTVVSGMVELVCKVGFSILFSSLWGTYGLWFAQPAGWILGLIPNIIYMYFVPWKQRAMKADEEAKAPVELAKN